MPDDCLLLAQHRAARWLGRVRGENGLDEHRIQEFLQSVSGHSGRFEFEQRVLESPGLIAHVTQVITAPANAMHFLGRVDHLEIR